MNTEVLFSSKSEMWETPQDFFDKLDEEFHFDLDVCATPENAKCKRYYTPEMDGLSLPWEGVCWCNPPCCGGVNMSGEIALRPSYWASVSGGKDSLYMLNYILHNLDRYPLDGVVHFELEIDYPFIHDVIDYMESECKRFGIRFVRIKPRRTWEEWFYNISPKTGRYYGFPTRTARWCNSAYKLDAKRQLSEWLNSIGFYVVHYIGYCADEERRFNKRLTAQKVERYPLAENGITEDGIWEWAKTQPIFNHFYETNKRCGCMYCPISSYLNYAYLYKYYPDHFQYMIEKMRETERLRERELGRPFSVISSNPKYNADYLENIIKIKWLKKLEEKEREYENR